MAGAVQIARDGVRGDGGPDGGQAVRSGNAGGYSPGRFNGNGEGRAVGIGVVLDHLGQAETPGFLLRQTEADDAAAFADEQGHLLLGEGGGGEDHVAFVFAVLVVHDKDAPALTDGGDGGADALGRGGGELMLAHGSLQVVGCAASGRQADARRGPWFAGRAVAMVRSLSSRLLLSAPVSHRLC